MAQNKSQARPEATKKPITTGTTRQSKKSSKEDEKESQSNESESEKDEKSKPWFFNDSKNSAYCSRR